MYQVIEDKSRIKALNKMLIAKLKETANIKRKPRLGTISGGWEDVVYYSEELDFWLCNFIGQNNAGEDNRYWNGFGLWEPQDDVGISIVCEINVPLSGINRRVAAAFAEDDYGRVVLLHRGKIGGGRVGIGKSLFVENYRGDFVDAEDGDRTTSFALVADLNSERLPAQIKVFIEEVDRIKKIPFADSKPLLKPPVKDSFSGEFSGKKKVKGRKPTEANCNHGLIVNQLEKILRKQGYKVANDKNRDLYTLKKSGKISTIFEIKPDTTNSSIYSGIGQLIIYDIGINANLFLVIPKGLDKTVKKKLSSKGIECIEFEWKGSKVIFDKIEKLKF